MKILTCKEIQTSINQKAQLKTHPFLFFLENTLTISCGIRNLKSPQVGEYRKDVLDSAFHVIYSEFRVLDSTFLVTGTWILDFNRRWDSRFLELYSGFQSPGFLVLQANISRVPDSLIWGESRQKITSRVNFIQVTNKPMSLRDLPKLTSIFNKQRAICCFVCCL